MSLPIPNAALDDRLGFVGMTGSGKTFGAGTCVERILANKGRAIIPDPLGVWWGLRLLADGKTPSKNEIVIFGGPHGDLPLTPHAGALIGETVAGMRESAIIDLSQFETAASERRFMLAFLDALYRRSTGEPVHLIFDEADMWAPERIVDKEGDATKLHGVMQTVVRRGRIKGLTSWLITQRPAVLSKNVLSQIDGLVAFRLTASQDRKALGAWIEGQADRDAGKAILGRLPEKARGEAVVWLPGRGILSDVNFPLKQTYDSSRAPKRGETRATVALAPLDLGALKERLSAIEAETKANDPKALKAEIARLTREIAQKPVAAPSAEATRDAYDNGVADGRREGDAQGYERGWRDAAEALQGPTLVAIAAVRDLDQAIRAVPPPASTPNKIVSGRKQVVAQAQGAGSTRERPKASVVLIDGALTKPQARILASLAFWKSIGQDAPSREQVAAVAGYRPGSGGFNNLLGGLRSAEFIDYPAAGAVRLNGRAPGIDAMSRDEARGMLLSVLSNPQRRIIDAMIDGEILSRDEIASRSDYSAGSGGFNNLLGSLRTLNVIDYPQSGSAVLSDWAKELLGQ